MSWVLLVGSLLLWRTTSNVWWSAIAMVGFASLVEPRAARLLGRIGSAARSTGSRAIRAMATLSSAVIALPLLLAPCLWVMSGTDPLRAPRGWTRCEGHDGRSGGLRRVLVAATCGVLLFPVFVSDAVAPPPTEPVPSAFAGVAWYPEYRRELAWVLSAQNFNAMTDQIDDVSTRYVNVREGRRRTWEPPQCAACPTVTVWVYGGSTTFGVGQRDEHTIPSELSRIAWEKGYRLDVSNRGVPEDTHWDGARRFAWDVAGGEAPDLVVFYDGVNDIGAAQLERDPVEPPSHTRPRMGAELRRRFPTPQAPAPPGSRLPERQVPRPEEPAEWAEVIVDRYARATELSSGVAESAGAAAYFFWQPSIDDRTGPEAAEISDGVAWARTRSDEIVDRLPDRVVDLTDVFDGVRQRLFSDAIHTNELGARLVARSIFDSLEPRLDTLAGSVPVSGTTGSGS